MSNGTHAEGALHRAVDGFERFLEEGQVWVGIVAGALLFALQIPGVHELFGGLGLYDDAQFLAAIAAVMLTSILIELYQLKRRVMPAVPLRQQYPDPDEMYDALREKAREITDPAQQEIKVLGLTLYSAWPKLSFFLERPEIHDWTVKLATLASDAHGPRHWVPRDWPGESAVTVNQIRNFRAKQGKEHRHQIEVFEYEFPPAVHGFELGNGDVFVSTLKWQAEGHLGKHRFSYDYVPSYDISPGAAAARELFRNWFERAVLSASETASGEVSSLSPPEGDE